MTYYFLDKSALYSPQKKSFKKIIISNRTYEEVKDTSLLEGVDYSVYTPIKSYPIAAEISAALAYDYYEHPDETVFVTGNAELGDLANRYFGNDSIKILKKEN